MYLSVKSKRFLRSHAKYLIERIDNNQLKAICPEGGAAQKCGVTSIIRTENE